MSDTPLTDASSQNGNIIDEDIEDLCRHQFHKWMKLQESINRDIAGELQKLRNEIDNLKHK